MQSIREILPYLLPMSVIIGFVFLIVLLGIQYGIIGEGLSEAQKSHFRDVVINAVIVLLTVWLSLKTFIDVTNRDKPHFKISYVERYDLTLYHDFVFLIENDGRKDGWNIDVPIHIINGEQKYPIRFCFRPFNSDNLIEARGYDLRSGDKVEIVFSRFPYLTVINKTGKLRIRVKHTFNSVYKDFWYSKRKNEYGENVVKIENL